MKHNVVAPSVGESITEVSILKWTKQNGQAVKVGEMLLEIESDKATVEIVAEQNGVLQILKAAGERIPIGEVIGTIDDAATATATPSASAAAKSATPPPAPSRATPSAAAPAVSATSGTAPMAGPAARKLASEQGADLSTMSGTGKDGRVTKGDLLTGTATSNVPAASAAPAARSAAPAQVSAPPVAREGERRVPMSMLRQRIAERLVQAQHTAALLTTFNEVDMTNVMSLRTKHKDAFKAKNGVSLGFMSFFTRACCEALKVVPEVNAYIDGRDVVYHDFVDMGVAVGTERGLVVPVVRGAHLLDLAGIEKRIGELALKARDGKLSIADMSGGTFTISNGGVYGSLLSTPILNMPQSGILGMHKIQERPVALNGKVEIRPMMYLALSYDHRIIDGKGAVTFLVTVKDLLENPEKLNLAF